MNEKRKLCGKHNFQLQTPFKMVTTYICFKSHSAVKLRSGFYFLSSLLSIIATTNAAKAIISVRDSNTVMLFPFWKKPRTTWHHLLS